MTKFAGAFGSFVIICIALTLFAADNTPQTGEKCRGNFIRTDAQVIARKKSLACSIVIDNANHNQPILRINNTEIQTVSTTNVYEMRYRHFVEDNRDIGGGVYIYTLAPDEEWRDEPKQTVHTVAGVPLANEEVSIDGRICRTDRNGLVHATEGNFDLLKDFDNLSQRTHTYTIAVRGYYPISYTVYRTMPQRSADDEKRLEEPQDQDLLVKYGLNFHQSKGAPEQDDLECTLELPPDTAFFTAGVSIPVIIRVTNHGKKATSCLLARSFSRIPGINGKLFYFGAIKPGTSASFTRYINADRENLTSMAFAEFRFSDSWSIIPGKKLELKLPVIH